MRGRSHITGQPSSEEVPTSGDRRVNERRQLVRMSHTQTQSGISEFSISRSSARQEAGPFWYVSNPRIRTKAAGEKAIQLAERVRRRETDPAPEEQELFIALHTSACHVSRPAKQSSFAAAERQAWTERWIILRDFIVEHNLGLAYSMMHRFGPHYMDDDDLQSEAMLGLSRAVDRFNPWRGYRFSTYACNIIARALMRRGRQETRYRRLFPVQHDETHERAESMPDLEVGLYVERLRHVLDGNLGELTDVETKVLSGRFPPEHKPRLNFAEIGIAIGLSKERVRQIQNVALVKLRAALKVDPVLQG
jgi:RNA polymerase sigma factor (sigma-70 family)